jgi:prolipoprotein diacylglyceryl transferase
MIIWNVNPEIFHLGPFSIRWYGLLFALGFIVGLQIFNFIYKRENKATEDLNDLLWFMVVGTVLGARLGHCIFYEPAYYFSRPLEILQVWKGGLASHGAAIGILIVLYLYSKKKQNQPFFWLLDRIVITVALAGSFIRLGNLFNSEIIGKPTSANWGFIFVQVDDIPRYPTQLFEATAYFIVFIILAWIYLEFSEKVKDGFLFGLFLILAFAFRFIIEFFKENQTTFENGMALNMGQLLSIPFVLLGTYFVIKSLKNT